jgi:phospholipase/carboxylesterase
LAAGPARGQSAPGEKAPPVFVLLHGYGSRAREWLQVTEHISAPAGTRYLLPDAPERVAAGPGEKAGRAWWPLDLSAYVDEGDPDGLPDLSRSAPPGLAAARARVVAFLDELAARHGVRSEQVILGGFSQGAVVALDVALHDGRPLRGLVLLSGTLVNEQDWLERLPRRRDLPVLVTHSPEDPVLSYALAQRLAGELERAGWRVRFLSFAGGHAMPAPVVEALGAFAVSTAAPGLARGEAP